MKPSSRVWAGLGLAAIVGAVALLIAGGLKSNVVFFLTPSELQARSDDLVDAPLRLGGQVKVGSVHWDAETLTTKFVVTDSLHEISVRNHGAPPAMFKEGIGVVVEGHYRNTGVFESTNLMVKHSNEYAPPGEDADKMYRSLIRPEPK